MDILTENAGGIFTITFNRPEKKNAITTAMYRAMADALRLAQADENIRVIVFAGQNDVFTAGNDLEDFVKYASQFTQTADEPTIPVIEFMHALRDAQKPVIASVAGLAIGIGTTMLLHCDLVYLADNAKLSLPFTQLGLCPEFGSTLLLQQACGYQRAAEKLLLGEAFNAQEALEIGIANHIVPSTQLTNWVHQQAQKLVALSTEALHTTKRLMKSQQSHLVNEAMHAEMHEFVNMLQNPRTNQTLKAFLAKRTP